MSNVLVFPDRMVVSLPEHLFNSPVDRQRANLAENGVDTSDMTDADVTAWIKRSGELATKLADFFPEIDPRGMTVAEQRKQMRLTLASSSPARREAFRKLAKQYDSPDAKPKAIAKFKTTANARTRHGSYIFQRPGSANWYIKLRSPGAKRVEKSLGTSDKLKAESLAGELITAHKAALLAARPRVETTFVREYEPGLHTGLNGERIYATDREIHYLDENPVRIESNGVLSRRIVGGSQSAKSEFEMFDAAHDERPTVPKKNGDDEILDTYLNHRNIEGYARSEAETVWRTFKELTSNKALKDCTRDDGRLLAQHFKDAGNKSATVVKKVSWLRAAVRLAIKEGQLQFNPFAEVVAEDDDKLKRKPLSDADMKVCKKNLGTLSESDRLLFRFLATTGARLGEAFQIDGEATERGVRYVVIGSKTEASQRRVPLPADMLAHLPKKIVGPLFTGDTRAASTRLNRFLDECGLTDPSIVVHSLRHRAADRLRAYECPIDIRRAILGHEDRSVSEGYGDGFSVKLLRKWIDCISF